MKLGNLLIDPAKSPGVLATATWDPDSACRHISHRLSEWNSWYQTARQRGFQDMKPHAACGCRETGSEVVNGEVVYLAAVLSDSQTVFLSVGPMGDRHDLGAAAGRFALQDGISIIVYPADAPTIDRFCRHLDPPNAPQILGSTPRLGIGSRMTTRVWPGMFAAMESRSFSANIVQNSVRELNLLDDMVEGRSPERNYAFCFGEIESGYTGSTFEGLWVSGTLAALLHPAKVSWGADADHIQLKRNDPDHVRARKVIDAARYYTFFTIDAADILDYSVLAATGNGETLLRSRIPDERTRRDVLLFHSQSVGLGGQTYTLDEDLIGRLVGKYWESMEGMSDLASYIAKPRGDRPFDLEYAFDENPPGVAVQSSVSSEEEIVFVMREINRRALPVSHLAPNFGIEKGYDYRLNDGLGALEARVGTACRLVHDTPLLIDVHSADDLSAETRKVIGRAGHGRLHYKVSPSLQFIFADLLSQQDPSLFREWWDDAFSYAEREAANGSQIAAECLEEYRSSINRTPTPHHEVFHKFYFAFPGRRDSVGRYENRERLYSLSERFYEEYNRRIGAVLGEIADDVLSSQEA